MTYETKAENFCKENKIKFQILETSYGKHFHTDKDNRYIFKIRLSHGRKFYTFNFGQSIFNGSKEPLIYDVLSCLQKYEVGSFENFCGDFGYENNKISKKIYKAVSREFEGVERVFSHCIDELREIE